MSTPRRLMIGTALLAALLAFDSRSLAREPIDLVPAESLVCWYGRPLPDASATSSDSSALQTLLELGSRIANSAGTGLNPEAQLGVRMAEMFSLTTRYPYALALIDARAKPLESDPSARRVDRLRFALIVQNQGQSEPFLRIIQKAVNEQTNSGAATLASRRIGDRTYQELRDQRLPQWSAIAWGHIDNCFVLTVGEDVWPQVAAVAAGELPGLTYDPWYAVARGQWRDKSLIEIFVAADLIQERLDPFVDGRASGFFRAWDAQALTRAHWALGFEDRALFCVAHFRIKNETVRRIYADPHVRDAKLLATIPVDARYAVFQLPLDRFVSRFFAGLVAIQGDKVQQNVRRVWAEMQARHGFDAERDILAHLGDRIVLHNDPPHPLRLPLAVTTLVEIRNEPATVRKTMETLCTAWREVIEEAAARSGNPPDFTLHRDDDGVWYLQFGPLAGLAWTTTDRFIITSWSPHALREYLAKVGSAVGTR